MNLTDTDQTPIARVFEYVKREAARYGVMPLSSEIVGLIPKKALEMSAEYFLRFENFKPELVLENRMADALVSRSGLAEFLDALAAPTATPGGGSASAAAAAMGAALGAMVTKLAKQDSSSFEEDRHFFTEAVDRDSKAFEDVMAAYQRPKAERAPFIEEALHGATVVPLETWNASRQCWCAWKPWMYRLVMGPDLQVGKALAAAAKTGALENVRANLESIKDQEFRSGVQSRLQTLKMPPPTAAS